MLEGCCGSQEDAVDCTAVGMLLPEIHLWIRIMFQMHSHLDIGNQVTFHIFGTTSNRFQPLDDLHSLTHILCPTETPNDFIVKYTVTRLQLRVAAIHTDTEVNQPAAGLTASLCLLLFDVAASRLHSSHAE